MALNAYIKQVSRLLHDPTFQFYNQTDLTDYINLARSQIAGDGQCVRVLPPSGVGQNRTTQGQEVYTFASINALNILGSGVASIMGVLSVSVSWGSMKPTLRQREWTWFQAFLRSYNTGLQNFPSDWSQYSQGVNGSIYLWPIPSQACAMDWDCYCLPSALSADADPEAIPYPWTDAIPSYAAYLAYDNAQRADDADRMFQQFERYMKRARKMSEASFIPDMYDGG